MWLSICFHLVLGTNKLGWEMFGFSIVVGLLDKTPIQLVKASEAAMIARNKQDLSL